MADIFFLGTVLALTALPAFTQGLGDLTVSPTRVVFEDRTRSAQLALVHRGNKPATYRLSFVQMRMSEQGELTESASPRSDERHADALVRFSPRQVTLEPGVAQTVRLLLRRPAELEVGEYRSHLLLRAIPTAATSTSVETLEVAEQDLEIALVPIYGVAVPVIVRHGDLAATARLAGLALRAGEDAEPVLTLNVERGGERSLYGELEVTYLPGDDGSETVLGIYRGLAVYTPNRMRSLNLPLELPEGFTLDGGKLRVSFAESGREDAASDQAEVPVG